MLDQYLYIASFTFSLWRTVKIKVIFCKTNIMFKFSTSLRLSSKITFAFSLVYNRGPFSFERTSDLDNSK